MARTANRFTDPATGLIYDWPLNHSTEDAIGKQRAVSAVPNVGLTGRISQQSDDGPYVRTLHGTIRTRAHYLAMWQWFALCAQRTILFRDFDGQEFEVQITGFSPTLVPNLTMAAPDPSMPHHHYTYDMQLTVYAFVAGDLVDAGVNP